MILEDDLFANIPILYRRAILEESQAPKIVLNIGHI